MLSGKVLYWVVVGFWFLFWIVYRKKMSVIPIIPFVPIALLLLWFGLDYLCRPWGTVVTFAIHLVLFLGILVEVWMDWREKKRPL